MCIITSNYIPLIILTGLFQRTFILLLVYFVYNILIIKHMVNLALLIRNIAFVI